MAWTQMQPRNAVSSKLAECYVTLYDDEHPNGQRYNFMSAVNLEVKFEKTKTEIPILGRPNKGHKATGSTITGSGEFHLNNSIWREIAYKFQENGEDLYFDMTIINEDPTASDVGRQEINLYGCNFDSVILAKFDADSEDTLMETLDFTAERFEIGTSFNLMDGIL